MFAKLGVNFEGDELRATVFKDGKLQLLLKLLGAERIGERGLLSDLHG